MRAAVGIVQNADPEVVQLVEDLVTSYVRGNCLILVTLTMSGAYLLALQSNFAAKSSSLCLFRRHRESKGSTHREAGRSPGPAYYRWARRRILNTMNAQHNIRSLDQA